MPSADAPTNLGAGNPMKMQISVLVLSAIGSAELVLQTGILTTELACEAKLLPVSVHAVFEML